MALLLVQHGLSLAKDIDSERGLSDKGIAIVKEMANLAKEKNLEVKKILHSGKKRALQSAEIFAASLNPAEGIEQITGINPTDDVNKFADIFEFKDNIMLVGHLPFLEKLTSYLITGSDQYLPVKFQNGGVVCLDRSDQTDDFFIKWTLMPEIKL